jgi:hypothetical protein
MSTKDTLVKKIIRSLTIPGNAARSEIESELASHLDDMIEEARTNGCNDREIEELVLARFGDPEEIARQFAGVYKPGSGIVRAAEFLILAIGSLALVLAFTGAAQAVVAVSVGLPASSVLTRGHARAELGALAGLAFGYLALCFSALVLPSAVKLKSVLLIASAFFLTGAALQALIPPQGLVFGFGLACAVLLRAVEALFSGKLMRVIGIAAVLSIGADFMPTCLRSASDPATLLEIIPIGLSVAVSCQLLAAVARAFDRRQLRRDFI